MGFLLAGNGLLVIFITIMVYKKVSTFAITSFFIHTLCFRMSLGVIFLVAAKHVFVTADLWR